MSDINSWLFPGAAMSANQLNNSLANNGNWLNNMLQNQVLFNQSQPRLGEAASFYSKLSADYSRASMAGNTGPGAYMYSDFGIQPASETYNYGSLYGSGEAATPPSAYSYGADIGGNYGGMGARGYGSSTSSIGVGGSSEHFNPTYGLDTPNYSDPFGGLGGGIGGVYQGPGNTIDWSQFRMPSSSTFNDWSQYINPSSSAADYGASLFGGLGGGAGANATAGNQIDWTKLFGGSGAQNAQMPQQQPIDFSSLSGRGLGGTSNAPSVSETAPAPMPKAPEYGGASFGGAAGGLGGADQGPGTGINWSKLFGGNWFGGTDTTNLTPATQMPGGLGVPITQQSEQPAYDYGSLFGHDNTGKPAVSDVPQTSQRYSDALYGTSTGLEAPQQQGTGITAADLAGGASQRLASAMEKLNQATTDDFESISTDQARARLAGLLAEGSEKDVYPGEAGRAGMVSQQGENPLYPAETGGTSPFAGYTRETQDISPEQVAELQYRGDLPIPKARPTEANAPLDIRPGMQGRQDALNTLKSQLAERGLTMTSGYRSPDDPLSQANPHSAHSQGRAFDTRAHTPAEGDAAMGQIREMLNGQGLVEGRDYKILDEVRNPSGWATGPHIHTQFTNEGMDKLQQSFGSPGRPSQDIPYPQGVPTPQERPAEAPPREAVSQSPTEEAPRPQEDIPFPDGVPLPAARPAAADAPPAPPAEAPRTGLGKAHTLLDTNVGDLVRKNSPGDINRVPSSIAAQTLREALGNTMTGGMIRSGITPYLGKFGVTQADFDKAVAQGHMANPPRFGGDFGSNPEFSGQSPSAGAFTPFEGFRQSPDFENRADQQPGFLQSVYDRIFPPTASTELQPEVAMTPLGVGLGLNDIRLGQDTADPFSGEAGRSGYLNPQSVREALSNVTDLSRPSLDSSLIGPGMGGKGSMIPGIDPITAQYLTMEPRLGAGMQKQFEDYPGSFTPQDQQRQLQEQNAPAMQALENDPRLMRTMLGLMLGEEGLGAKSGNERIMLAESALNRAAQTGKSIADTLSGPGVGAAYYPDSLRNLASNLAYMDAHPEVKARLMDELRTAGYGGSTLSNLATQNASLGVGAHVPPGAVAAFGPVNQETFYNKSFPYSTTGVYQGDPTSVLRWYNQNAPVGQNTYGPLPGSGRR